MRTGEPVIDFCQFDEPAIGRTGVPLPPPVRVRRPDGEFDEFRNASANTQTGHLEIG